MTNTRTKGQPVVDAEIIDTGSTASASTIKHEVSANPSAEGESRGDAAPSPIEVASEATATTTPANAIDKWTPMTPEELDKLKSCEKIICEGIDTFIEVGTNLAIVRDTGLYRGTYPTFEAYIEGRWKFTKQRAYQLMSAAEYRNSLATRNPKALMIKSERATRELMKVPDSLVVNVLDAVVADGNVTADRIIEIRNQLVPKMEKKTGKAKAKKKLKPKIEAAIKGIGVWVAYLSACDVVSLPEEQRKQLIDLNKKAIEKYNKLNIAA